MSTRSFPFRVSIAATIVIGLIAASLPIGFGVDAATVRRSDSATMLDQAAGTDYPVSVTVEGEQFVFDRLVPLDRNDFERIADGDGIAFYARTGSPPFDVIFGLISGRSNAGLARYLPTRADTPDTPCPAEEFETGALNAGEATYAFAGIEAAIPTESLQQVATLDDQSVYADNETEQPYPELFIDASQGLLRYVIIGPDGRPSTLAQDVPFADQVYAFGSDVTDSTDPAALTKVGCFGSFPVFAASPQADAPLTDLVVSAAGRYLSYTATGPAPDDTVGGPSEQASTEATPDEGEQAPVTPSDEETQQEPTEATPDQATAEPTTANAAAPTEQAGSLPIQINDELGDAQDGLPRELAVGDSRFLFDRLVAVDTGELTEVAGDDNLVVFARSDLEPFDAVYVSVTDGDGSVARYLPERLESPDVQCPAEALNIGSLDADGIVYAFAGIETDLTEDDLVQITESDGQQVYADPGTDQPFPELFIADADNGLMRFVQLAENGVPTLFADSLGFAGATFVFTADVTDQVDQSSLTKAGCAGPFPVFAPQGEAFTQLFVGAGGQLFQFEGEAPAEASPVAEVPTETAIPTETPTVTAVPTETLVPTETPTPTTPPTETATTAPTETSTATIAPTETVAPTETLTATIAPTETPAVTTAPTEATSQETVAPTETQAPTETIDATGTVTSTPVPTTATAEATETPISLTAAEAGLPEQLEVQNTTYVFSTTQVEVDVQTLVQVDVVVVEGVEVTVYARQEVVGVAPELFCVSSEGQIVGRYVVAAAIQPEPPPDMPSNITVENNTYVFNEVSIEIDIQTLVEVDVVVIQNVELTVYAEQNVQGQAPRLFVVTPDGQVCQYVESSLVLSLEQPTPQPTVQLEPVAVIPTLAANQPPPAAVTAIPSTSCPGDPGPTSAQGIPAYLPNRIQLGGISYTFTAIQTLDEAGTLTKIGCIGPFEVSSTDQADRSEVLYLRAGGPDGPDQNLFRFEAGSTFVVELEVTDQPRVISAGGQADQQYTLLATWRPSMYSSTTVILFAEDPENQASGVIYAVDVSNTVVGEVIGEYRLPGESNEPSQEMVAAAEDAGINPDLTINGQVYLLVAIYEPAGTTTNGFVTLYSSGPEQDAAFLLGRDKRRLELFIYERSEQEPVGG